MGSVKFSFWITWLD